MSGCDVKENEVEFLSAHGMELLVGALAFVGGAAALCKVVAPLTDTKVDDKLAGALSKLYGLLSKLALK
jgi:hypothetical protein